MMEAQLRLVCVVLLVTSAGSAAAAQSANQDAEGPAGEGVIISASRAPQKPIDVPAAVSVINDRTIEAAPFQNIGALLSVVPGVNATQISARHFNVTGRAAAGLLGPQLVLVDGRPLYQDSVGAVFWDLASVDPGEIERIEVVRGPLSAVWGANALDGVINIVTKSPREMRGSSFTLGAGVFQRSSPGVSIDPGRLFYMSGRHAQVVNDRWAYRISAATYTHDALPRPPGTIDETLGWRYPGFTNEGTRQPKLDVRADYRSSDDRTRLELAGGVAFTEGMHHSAIGPFALQSGSHLGFARVSYRRGGLRATYFTNQLEGDSENRLMQDGRQRTQPPFLRDAPLTLDFGEQTHDIDVSYTHTLAARHVLSYGGTWRHNVFDLSLLPSANSIGRVAPLERSRMDRGVYAEGVIRISPHVRAVLNGRLDYLDHVDYLDNVHGETLFSPRAAFVVNPAATHAVRFVYSQGYRSPSMFESFLESYVDTRLAEPIDLGIFDPLLRGRIAHLPILYAFGNERERLFRRGRPAARPVQPSLRAFELGYTANIAPRSLVSAAFYVNRMRNEVAFTVAQRYFPEDSPIGNGWPLPISALALIPGRSLPEGFVYRTLGDVSRKGFELDVSNSVNDAVNVFANYTWQGGPDPGVFANPMFRLVSAPSEVWSLSTPPRHRLNGGVTFNSDRWLGSASISRTSQAFWADVLDERYHGTTAAYILVNASVGKRWHLQRFVTSLGVMNLLNQQIQQHIFGDIVQRRLVAELRVTFLNQ